MANINSIRKILIANRGEIACRIIRTCQEMGIASVAVFSDADENALHVEMADEAIHIGANSAAESYLNIAKIIDAATQTSADAIHPGYGFLAENAGFAQSVNDAGLIFIGPPVSVIEAMGKKREAKLLLKDIPLLQGYNGNEQADESIISAADAIGYPVMVKASAGGGGKGMRVVHSAEDMAQELATARREAKQAFGDDELILEKLVENPRHIEIQIFGDQHGTVIALGERECSIQRRHQKIIEETPSTALDDDLRREMSAIAVTIGEQLGYVGAGTVEFLLDDEKKFFFMEMNTRLQVEHAVTERVYGIDLIRWQIEVAEGRALPTAKLEAHGHAIEARIYAEDPANGFLPVTGEILLWRAESPTTRFDTGVRSGDIISPHYDPMIAKVITYAETRDEAIRRLDYDLSKLQLLGLRNNIRFLRRVIIHPDFIGGDMTTRLIDMHPDLLEDTTALSTTAVIAAALAKNAHATVKGQTYWRNNPNRPIRHSFRHGDDPHVVALTPQSQPNHFSVQIDDGDDLLNVRLLSYIDCNLVLNVNGHRQSATVVSRDNAFWVYADGETIHMDWIDPTPVPRRSAEAEGSLKAPMPGQVISVSIEKGQRVKKGVILMTLEAMKMEHRIQAPYNGIVGSIHYQVGDIVQADAILLELQREPNN
jgi:geranyl-CoA carboxylase alpha subunit